MATPTPEIGRKPKAGLLHSLHPAAGAGHGTPAPGEGFALTIAQRQCAKLTFAHDHDRADVELGVALVAAKRASLVGRGPILDDVQLVMDLFALRTTPVVDRDLTAPFAGLAHSYAIQRRFVDAVTREQLLLDDPNWISSH
jgi:hypothetical protein